MSDAARNIAKIILRRHKLEPPVDIIKVLKIYADVEIVEIPFDFDGIALDLDSSSKPRVILNKIGVSSRSRFTAAHELGHVVIPWHQGAFFDDAEDVGEQLWAHAEMEREANTFASEILMPMDWLRKKAEAKCTLTEIQLNVASEAEVSPQAAAINLIGALPPGCVFACIDEDNIVVNSGRSHGTYAQTIKWGEHLPVQPYSYAVEHSYQQISRLTFHWWRLPDKVFVDMLSVPNLPTADWRETLAIIVKSLGLDVTKEAKIKASVNGVVAFVNGDCKRKGRHTADALMAAAIQRFHDRPEYAGICQHPLFEQFLIGKIRDLTA